MVNTGTKGGLVSFYGANPGGVKFYKFGAVNGVKGHSRGKTPNQAKKKDWKNKTNVAVSKGSMIVGKVATWWGLGGVTTFRKGNREDSDSR